MEILLGPPLSVEWAICVTSPKMAVIRFPPPPRDYPRSPVPNTVNVT